MLSAKIESILLVSNRPVSAKELASLCSCQAEEVKSAVEELKQKFNTEESGIGLFQTGDKVQFLAGPDSSEVVSKFVSQETHGELTRPQLETLTIIAYRGPIGKEDLEQIRGVNCTLVLRNLMMRGLVEENSDKSKMMKQYQVTIDFVRHLGITDVSDLPDYDSFHKDEKMDILVEGDQ